MRVADEERVASSKLGEVKALGTTFGVEQNAVGLATHVPDFNPVAQVGQLGERVIEDLGNKGPRRGAVQVSEPVCLQHIPLPSTFTTPALLTKSGKEAAGRSQSLGSNLHLPHLSGEVPKRLGNIDGCGVWPLTGSLEHSVPS